MRGFTVWDRVRCYAFSIAPPVPFPLYWVNDPVSGVTHLLGAVVVAAVTPRLLGKTRGWHRFSLAVFSFSAIALLCASAMFHWSSAGATRHMLQRLDHAAIFVLIAGTFTPVHTILFKGFPRWGMLWLIWTIGLVGIALKLVFFEHVPAWLGIASYVAMGWLGLFAMVGLGRRYSVRFMAPLLYGGLLYTAGAMVELANWPELWPRVIRPHEIFHVAVLAGLGCHWWFIARAAKFSSDRAMGLESRWKERSVQGGGGVSMAASA